jgi:hypothetical protein
MPATQRFVSDLLSVDEERERGRRVAVVNRFSQGW